LSEISREQVKYAQMKGVQTVTVPTEDITGFIHNGAQSGRQREQELIDQAVSIINSGQDVIIVSSVSLDRAEMDKIDIAARECGMTRVQVSKIVLKYMGRIMAGVMERVQISGIFVTGGDTTMGFLSEVGATGLRIVSEVLIGIPMTRIVGGKYDNTKVITKAGAFGQNDALFFCMRKLKEVN